MENKKLDQDSFGEIMDKIILENEIGMSIIMPEGTIEPEIQDNTGAGPVMQFYILLNALVAVVKNVTDLMGIEKDAREDLVDGILDLVKREIMEERHADRERNQTTGCVRADRDPALWREEHWAKQL